MKRLIQLMDLKSPYGPLENIPDRYHFDNLESNYHTQDFWEDFFTDWYPANQFSDKRRNHVQMLGDSWNEFSAENNRHPAFTSPDIITGWCKRLNDNLDLATIQKEYLNVLLIFYRYLVWNVDCPHIYNPVVYGITDSEFLKYVWEEGRCNNA